jgi:hypothetical protein
LMKGRRRRFKASSEKKQRIRRSEIESQKDSCWTYIFHKHLDYSVLYRFDGGGGSILI